MQYDKFFAGHVDGHGLVQDRSGKVIKRFDVAIDSGWHGDEFVSTEHYKYYDGKIQDRTSYIRKIDPDHYTGRARDIIGGATGEQAGSAIGWRYTMEVPADSGGVYDMDFDDWMYQMHDNLVIDRNAMSKYGVHVADITIVMQKTAA